MKIALCTISFRHQLISMKELAQFAVAHGFDGIELWGTHARSFYEESLQFENFEDPRALLKQNGLVISMISDYLNIAENINFTQIEEQTKRLISLADWLGVSRIRTFAGERPSTDVSEQERAQYVEKLNFIGDLCESSGKKLLLETHPNTLADQLDSTLQLMNELAHASIGINLDFFHLWESGTEPLIALEKLGRWADNFHLKNMISLELAKQFEPQNVYSPSGDRRGMIALSEGAIDYRPVLEKIKTLSKAENFWSLEWFGENPKAILSQDIQFIRHMQAAQPVG